jgi:Methyl-CpG binding domain
LAQSRAVGIKPQQLLNSNCDLEKVRQAIMEVNSDVHSNTDSESYNDTSGISESDGENDNFNLNDLKQPFLDGWKRETIIKGLTRTGTLKGDVQYYSPYNPTVKITNMNQLKEELSKNNCPYNDKNFSFSARRLVGTFLQAAPPNYATDGDYVKMTDYEVAQRLEEIRMYTRQPALQLNVEQRIEIARQQQALRDAKKIIKDEVIKTKEKVRRMDIEKVINISKLFTICSKNI